jgi:hypothetical protein
LETLLKLHYALRCKNGNAIALVFALLPAKSGDCYIKMWDLLIAACRERNLVLQPEVFHIDFEYAMRIAILTKFPNSTISCCRFHLGQSWWRKIQAVGFNADFYINKQIGPTSDVDSIFSKMYSQYVLFRNKYS